MAEGGMMDVVDVQKGIAKHLEQALRSGQEFGELHLGERDIIAVYLKKGDPLVLPLPFTTLPTKWLDAKEIKENGLLLAFFRWANLIDSDALPSGFVDALRRSVDKQNMYLGLALAGAWRVRSATSPDRGFVAETRKYSETVPKDVPGVVKEIMDQFGGIQNISLDIKDGIFVTKTLFWDERYPTQEGWPDWFLRSKGRWNDLPFVSKADPRTERVDCYGELAESGLRQRIANP